MLTVFLVLNLAATRSQLIFVHMDNLYDLHGKLKNSWCELRGLLAAQCMSPPEPRIDSLLIV